MKLFHTPTIFFIQFWVLAEFTPLTAIKNINSDIFFKTANRFVSASNPYNPYFGPGIMPIQIGTEHATTALTSSSLNQAMSITSNAGTQPQKRTDRVQVNQNKILEVFVLRLIVGYAYSFCVKKLCVKL